MVDSGTRAGPRRRWTVPAGLAAVGLLFGYVLTHRVEAGDPAAGAGRPPGIAAQLEGPRGTVSADVRVLLGGTEPVVLDVRTGTLSPLAGLRAAPGEQVRLTPVPGGGVLATLVGDRRSRVLLLRDGAGTDLGEALQAVPLRTGQVALVTQGNGRTQVRLRGSDGSAGPAWSIRGLATAVRDTAGGLLLSRVLRTGSSGGELALVDPATGADRRRLGTARDVLAVTDTQAASVDGACRADCRVVVTDLTTGRERALPAVAGPAPEAAALSPDGESLALSVPSDPAGGSAAPRAGFVTVLDLVEGGSRVLPGVRPASGQYAGVAWAPDSTLLAVAVWRGQKAAVGLWALDRPDEPPVVLPAEPTAAPGSALATTEA